MFFIAPFIYRCIFSYLDQLIVMPLVNYFGGWTGGALIVQYRISDGDWNYHSWVPAELRLHSKATQAILRMMAPILFQVKIFIG
jgi:hypothetical protein